MVERQILTAVARQFLRAARVRAARENELTPHFLRRRVARVFNGTDLSKGRAVCGFKLHTRSKTQRRQLSMVNVERTPRLKVSYRYQRASKGSCAAAVASDTRAL